MKALCSTSTILLACAILPSAVLGGDVLQSNGFSMCSADADITVQKLNIQYDKGSNQVVFDVAGTSTKQQEVTATLTVTAYGQQVYTNTFDPCSNSTRVAQLCPIPSGSYSANGSQAIPEKYANLIPAIAFTVPDLDGMAKLTFTAKDTGEQVACIQSAVGNGKTFSVPAVPLVAAGVAGTALLVSGLSALGAGGQPGVSSPSPSFADVIGWFQSMAMNGMLSVTYPQVYRSFSRNFGFAGLLIPWDTMQSGIDAFRQKTGGNLTDDSVDFLKNATFVYQGANGTITKRSLFTSRLVARASTDSAGSNHVVSGIQAYVEPFIIPKSNTFMTVLMIFGIIILAIVIGILLFKLVLELVALMGKLSKPLDGFRKRYWWIMAKTITNLILLLYGVWTLYCVYQFTQGDSWAAKVLAGITLAIFTGVLVWFSWKIWSLARMYRKADGDASALFENKETWRKYSIFYEHYKKSYWWVFIPVIIYTFARGVIIAAGDGHGLFQTGGQLILEAIMLLMLIFFRPYAHKSSNWISITIQVVKLLSVLCILVFVDQIGMSDAPKAITGIVLVAMQSVLTGLLAILIIVNGLIHLCRTNPHRKARKEAEKQRDTLTPLDPHASFLDPERWQKRTTFESLDGNKPYVVDTSRYDHIRKPSSTSMQMPLLPHVSLPSQYRTSRY
ncbi:TRP-domain-containing protein [Microthyrium microscopicum]|uniref:TRP-domain-containing protein n=1 Tax=Microthyrium microscopicum TaxID=703497 RepID=A0A6A6TZU4_9PEZI|nr:TRP-domain-containing protein [Microthyrium microscopicum]